MEVENMKTMVVLTIAVVAIAAFLIVPILLFWSIGTLFGFKIEANIYTMAAFWIFSILNPFRSWGVAPINNVTNNMTKKEAVIK
jgi:hypothetical protein